MTVKLSRSSFFKCNSSSKVSINCVNTTFSRECFWMPRIGVSNDSNTIAIKVHSTGLCIIFLFVNLQNRKIKFTIIFKYINHLFLDKIRFLISCIKEHDFLFFICLIGVSSIILWLDLWYLIRMISKESAPAALLYIYNNSTVRYDGNMGTIWETKFHGLLKYTHTHSFL